MVGTEGERRSRVLAARQVEHGPVLRDLVDEGGEGIQEVVGERQVVLDDRAGHPARLRLLEQSGMGEVRAYGALRHPVRPVAGELEPLPVEGLEAEGAGDADAGQLLPGVAQPFRVAVADGELPVAVAADTHGFAATVAAIAARLVAEGGVATVEAVVNRVGTLAPESTSRVRVRRHLGD